MSIFRSQNTEIKEYLEAGGKLAPLDALREFSCFRLGARIHDLKKEGMNIKTEIINVGGKRVARYSL